MTGAALSSLAEFESLAQARLDPGVWAFLAGGAGEGRAVAANLAAFARRTLRPRVLVDVSGTTTRAAVLGRDVSLPVLVAPVALQGLLHEEGERATARAAARSGTVMCVSLVSQSTPAEVAAAAPGARLWFQLYCTRDPGLNADIVGQARDAGFEALVVTVDGPVLGRRDDVRRAGFRLPDDFRIGVTARDGRPGLTPAEFAGLIDPSLTWADLDALAGGLPLVVKGILTREDAQLACDHGAAAVVVSNHGGRQLDAAPASLDCLAEVVEAVAGRAEVLLDGGVRCGSDVAIAIALGATAVLVGRPVMWGLAASGEQGATAVLELFRAELENTLALCGCRSPHDLAPAHVGEVR